MRHPPLSTVRSATQLGAALRRHRKALGMTQADLAQKASLRQATISQIERGDAMRADSLFAILAAMDLELTVSPRTTSEPIALQDIF